MEHLEVAKALYVSVRSGSNWNLERLVFGERGKSENPEKNLSERQGTNNKLVPFHIPKA